MPRVRYVPDGGTCGDGSVDVKEELKTRQKCCRIKGFKTDGSILSAAVGLFVFDWWKCVCSKMFLLESNVEKQL